MTKSEARKMFPDHPWYPYPWYEKECDAPHLGKHRNWLQNASMPVAIQVMRARTIYAYDTNGITLIDFDGKYDNYVVLKCDRLSLDKIKFLAGLPESYTLKAKDVYEGLKLHGNESSPNAHRPGFHG